MINNEQVLSPRRTVYSKTIPPPQLTFTDTVLISLKKTSDLMQESTSRLHNKTLFDSPTRKTSSYFNEITLRNTAKKIKVFEDFGLLSNFETKLMLRNASSTNHKAYNRTITFADL